MLSKVDHKIDDSYVKNFISCKIKDVSTGNDKEIEVFVKTLPILNVVHFLTNEYRLKPSVLPNSYFNNTITK